MKDTDLKAIRASLYKGWALGNDRFREQIARLSERRALRQGATEEKQGMEIINRV